MELYKKVQIVKGLITRFLKTNGFTKHYKGYIKIINHLIIKIHIFDISEDESTIKFKLFIKIRPERPIKLSRVLGFMSYTIPKGELYITNNYLNDLLVILNKYNNAENIEKELKEEINNLNGSIINGKKLLENEPNNKKIFISISLLEEKIKIINNYLKGEE